MSAVDGATAERVLALFRSEATQCAPSEIDAIERLRAGTAHDVIVGSWADDRAAWSARPRGGDEGWEEADG